MLKIETLLSKKKAVLKFRNPKRRLSLVTFTVSILLILLSFYLTQQKTNNTVYAASTNPIYWGAYVPNGFQIGTNLTTFIADEGGKGMAIIPWYLNFTTGFPTNTMTAIRGYGAIPELTWQPDGGGVTPAYSLANITNGNFDAYITNFAQAAKAWGHPFFLRFAQEMNGGYGWAEHTNGNSVGQYVPMWKHVHDIFASVGATNVTWVWCPNQGSSTAAYAELYPGDNYVDWTCLDGYNWGAPTPSQTWAQWQSFSTIFKGNYNSLVSIAPTKPMMIGETASAENGGNKATWITDTLVTQLPTNFPQIKAFLWFNEANTQWRIETSPAAQQAFTTGIASSYYTANIYGNISQSPIQPPSSQVISQPAPSLTTAVTGTATPSPTFGAGTTAVSISVCPHGLGNCGDNVNPNGGGGNTIPLHPQRTLSISFISNSKTATFSGTVLYNTSSKNFQGIIPVTNLPSGQYLVKVSMSGFLTARLASIVTITPGQPLTLPTFSLTNGDINNDNQLDILDYNLLISCYGSKQSTASCTTGPGSTPGSGITDQGSVGAIDYNLFLRELSVQKGA